MRLCKSFNELRDGHESKNNQTMLMLHKARKDIVPPWGQQARILGRGAQHEYRLLYGHWSYICLLFFTLHLNTHSHISDKDIKEQTKWYRHQHRRNRPWWDFDGLSRQGLQTRPARGDVEMTLWWSGRPVARPRWSRGQQDPVMLRVDQAHEPPRGQRVLLLGHFGARRDAQHEHMFLSCWGQPGPRWPQQRSDGGLLSHILIIDLILARVADLWGCFRPPSVTSESSF